MSNISRYLITTADERTWRFDQPVIFSGEWCRLYERQHIWQNGLDHLLPGAKAHYQELADVGILHFSPKTISEKINYEWKDIELWWNRLDIQKARDKFCDQYARQIDKPIQELASILTENLE
jgi:hypothetical protein